LSSERALLRNQRTNKVACEQMEENLNVTKVSNIHRWEWDLHTAKGRSIQVEIFD